MYAQTFRSAWMSATTFTGRNLTSAYDEDRSWLGLGILDGSEREMRRREHLRGHSPAVRQRRLHRPNFIDDQIHTDTLAESERDLVASRRSLGGNLKIFVNFAAATEPSRIDDVTTRNVVGGGILTLLNLPGSMTKLG